MILLILRNGECLELAENDFSEDCNWQKANELCQSLGPEWRLPTISELTEIFNARKHFDFANYGYGCYWSCSETDESSVKILCGDGVVLENEKASKNFVRAVKSKR